jgi:glycosyltransferase involved in cell wall biosynthesis
MTLHQNQIAVIGVVYPAVKKYLYEYLESLENQSNNKFDLLLANDGLTNTEEYLKHYPTLKVILHKLTGSITEIRIQIIQLALEAGYKKIIFTDCDDTIAINRIEVTEELLDYDPIIFNDLNVTNESGVVKEKNYFSNRLKDKSLINSNDFLHCNMMGLSNAATTNIVLSKIINNIKNRTIIAFDWLLWTYAINNGYQAKFTNSTTTNYRVYPKNIAGLPQPINKESVLRGLAIKEKHYNELSSYSEQYSHLNKIFSDANKKSQDKQWLDEYILALLEKKIEHPLWWENIREPKQAGII